MGVGSKFGVGFGVRGLGWERWQHWSSSTLNPHLHGDLGRQHLYRRFPRGQRRGRQVVQPVNHLHHITRKNIHASGIRFTGGQQHLDGLEDQAKAQTAASRPVRLRRPSFPYTPSSTHHFSRSGPSGFNTRSHSYEEAPRVRVKFDGSLQPAPHSCLPLKSFHQSYL